MAARELAVLATFNGKAVNDCTSKQIDEMKELFVVMTGSPKNVLSTDHVMAWSKKYGLGLDKARVEKNIPLTFEERIDMAEFVRLMSCTVRGADSTLEGLNEGLQLVFKGNVYDRQTYKEKAWGFIGHNEPSPLPGCSQVVHVAWSEACDIAPIFEESECKAFKKKTEWIVNMNKSDEYPNELMGKLAPEEFLLTMERCKTIVKWQRFRRFALIGAVLMILTCLLSPLGIALIVWVKRNDGFMGIHGMESAMDEANSDYMERGLIFQFHNRTLSYFFLTLGKGISHDDMIANQNTRRLNPSEMVISGMEFISINIGDPREISKAAGFKAEGEVLGLEKHPMVMRRTASMQVMKKVKGGGKGKGKKSQIAPLPEKDFAAVEVEEYGDVGRQKSRQEAGSGLKSGKSIKRSDSELRYQPDLTGGINDGEDWP